MYSKGTTALLALSQDDQKILGAIAGTSRLISEIVVATKIPRSTIVHRLASLSKRGLVSASKQGKRTYWKSIPEDNLLARSHSVKSLGSIETYHGVKDLMELWKKIVTIPKNSRFTVMQPHRSFELALRKSPKKFAVEISKKIKDRKFIIDAIEQRRSSHVLTSIYGNTKVGKALTNAFVERLEDIVEVPDSFIDEQAEFYLYTDHVVFIDWVNEIGVLIHSRQVYRLMLSVFEKVKAYGSRYQQGEYIKRISQH